MLQKNIYFIWHEFDFASFWTDCGFWTIKVFRLENTLSFLVLQPVLVPACFLPPLAFNLMHESQQQQTQDQSFSLGPSHKNVHPDGGKYKQQKQRAGS